MKALNPVEESVIALIEPAVEAIGYRIVRVRLSGLKRKTLQIMAERAADGLMGLEDCVRLSRTINPILDQADPVKGEYSLEISSPGIDRPLVREDDYARFAGHEAKLETTLMIDGRKRFRGELLGVDDGAVRLMTAEGAVSVPLGLVQEARLVLTDRLIEEDLRRAKTAEAADAAGETPSAAANSKTKKRTKPS